MNANGSVEGQAHANPGASKALPASKVGNSFASMYYTRLCKSPESVHLFYDPDASFAHLVKGSKSGDENNVRGLVNIAEAIKKLNYAGKTIEVESVDCQESANGSILVMVTGVFKDGSSYRSTSFTQTFVLTAKVSQHYLVQNDVLRFLDADEAPAQKAKASKSSSKESKASRAAKAEDKKKEAEDKKKEPEAPKSSPLAAAPAAKSEAPVASTKGDKKPEKKEKQKKPKREPKQAAPAAAAAAAAPPSSWAARLGHKAPASAPEPATASTEGKASGGKAIASDSKTAPPAAGEATAASAAPAAAATQQQGDEQREGGSRGDGFKEVSRAKRTANKREGKKQHDEREGDDISAQIYVNNLPSGATEEDIVATFKKFGAVKHVQMSKEKIYCFVHFAAAAAVDAVLAAKPVNMGENELSIDRRRRPRWADRSDRSDGTSRRGRFPRRGRGGGGRGRRGGGEGRSEGST